jgi:hypothetical protein
MGVVCQKAKVTVWISIEFSHRFFYTKDIWWYECAATQLGAEQVQDIQGVPDECAKLREGVRYVKLYRKTPKHLYPKLNSYGDNGHRKVWSSLRFHALYLVRGVILVRADRPYNMSHTFEEYSPVCVCLLTKTV